ncbi:MAG: SPFH domain-containing protein [Coriobacteriia bacterium]|nr:SPFH domain-containing protein [Coriobacteriia bacterium]
MGLIAAATGALGGVLADQYKEYFYCDSMPPEVLMTKGKRHTSERATNKGSENIITNGSVIAVNEGQAMAIVSQGKIVEFTAEPGAFKWEGSTEPSIFTGDLAQGIMDTVQRFADRFTFGADTGADQRVYFFNLKEIMGNKYGTPTPIPFRVVDRNVNLDIDISVRCNGEYSYKIVDPLLFYINVASNVTDTYTRDQLDSQMRTELLAVMQDAFSAISEKGVRYSAIPAHTTELCEILDQKLSPKWTELRGIKIVSFGMNSISASEEDQERIKNLQMAGALRDENMRAGSMAAATADAMRIAAGNEAGAMTGFMGMGFANMTGQQMGQTMYSPNAGAGYVPTNNYPVAADGGFGAATRNQPAAAAAPAGWTCSCGATSTGNFCAECGSPKPADPAGWTCSCGAVNQGKFCPECGSPKPAGALQYRCDKCGWQPEDPANPPKFCPECGDPFGDEDVVR